MEDRTLISEVVIIEREVSAEIEPEKNFIEKRNIKRYINIPYTSIPQFDNGCDENSFMINEETFLVNGRCILING